jgi:hypothetical protein
MLLALKPPAASHNQCTTGLLNKAAKAFAAAPENII